MVKYGTARTDYLVTILAKGNLFYVQRSASGDGGGVEGCIGRGTYEKSSL